MPYRTFHLIALPTVALTTILLAFLSSPTLPTTASVIEIQIANSQFSDIAESASLRDLFRRIFRDETDEGSPLISRGGFCLLAPARPGQDTVIWHQNPVFVWHGSFDGQNRNIDRLEVVDHLTAEIIWSYRPTMPEETYVKYDGDPLQSGRVYDVNIYQTAEATAPTIFPPFEILPSVNRRLIANGLAVAEQKIGDTVGSREVVRAQYFTSRNLPVDALQALFETDVPEEALIEARQDIAESLCLPKQAPNADE